MPEIGNKTSNANIDTADIDIVDGAFNASQSGIHHLSIQTGQDRLSFCILNTVTNKYVVFRSYLLSGIDLYSRIAGYRSVFEKDDLLGLKYKTSSHIWTSPRFTFVPEHLFDKAYADLFLMLNHGVADEQVLQNHVQQAGLYNVFSYPEALTATLKSYQPGIRFFHHATSFISTVITEMLSSGGSAVAVYFYGHWLDIAVTDKKKQLFYNTFYINAPEDSVYYLAGVSNMLDVDLPSAELIYAGDLKKMPPETAILKNHVKSITDCKPCNATYSHYIEDSFLKEFFTLFNLYGCE